MRFQSLFSWMFRPKPSFRRVCRDGNLFQSLFSWMFRPKPRLDPVPIQHEMFQSLFSWMFRPKLGYSAIRHSPRSFNPCSRGCFARRSSSIRFRTMHHRFQSLFSWMFRPKGIYSRSMTRRSTVSILVLVDVSPEVLPDCLKPELSRVSILVLVDVSPEDIDRGGPGSIEHGFQSLFSWMFRPKRPYSSIPRSHPRFQSLFSWMFRPKFEDAARVGDFLSVSILVLVDVSPEEPQGGWRAAPDDVSILVLVDVSPEEEVPTAAQLRDILFQSLFSWMFRPKCIRDLEDPHRAHVSILVLVDVSPEAKSAGRRRTATVVSILVLVDVSPEDGIVTFYFNGIVGFNPCSRGCFARRLWR